MAFRHLFLYGLIALSFLFAPCMGQSVRNGMYGMYGMAPAAEPDPDASAAAEKIRAPLDELLGMVNELKRPSAAVLGSDQQLVDENKRFFVKMTDPQKAQFSLFMGWLAYYNNELENAFLNCSRACKLDETSGDAWVSQIIMTLLTDRKPVIPKAPQPVRVMIRPGRNRDPQPPREPVNPIQKGRLDFDPFSFYAMIVGKKIPQFDITTLDNKPFTYQPESEALCLLLWKKNSDVVGKSEPNTPTIQQSKPAAPEPRPVQNAKLFMDETAGDEGMPMDETIQQPGAGDIEAFRKLFRYLHEAGQAKYLSLNLDSIVYKQDILDEILKQSPQWDQAMNAMQQKAALGNLAKIEPGKSMLIMTDKSGMIRYAGPAEGCVVPMVAAKITSADISDLSRYNLSAEEIKVPVMPVDSNSLPLILPMPGEPNSPAQKHTGDPNTAGNDPNSIKPQQQSAAALPATPLQPQPGTPNSQYQELALEDQVQAEKLTVYAEDLFMKAARKKVLTYRQGVDLCRQIMKTYPNTEYFERARKLLRQVPENQRDRYNITDPEMGL